MYHQEHWLHYAASAWVCGRSLVVGGEREEEGKSGWERKTGGREGRKGTEEVMKQEGRSQ